MKIPDDLASTLDFKYNVGEEFVRFDDDPPRQDGLRLVMYRITDRRAVLTDEELKVEYLGNDGAGWRAVEDMPVLYASLEEALNSWLNQRIDEAAARS